MARGKIISESQVFEAKRQIESCEISLRGKANELKIHPSSLSDRIKKLNTQSLLSKPDTKPDIKKVKQNRYKIKDHIKLSTMKLRGFYEDLTFNPKIGKGINHRGTRNNCINLIIQELIKQKEL